MPETIARHGQPMSTSRRHRRRREGPTEQRSGVWYPRWYWPSFTLPGVLMLAVLFVLPAYVVLSVAFGTVDFENRPARPHYAPWWWSFGRSTRRSASSGKRRDLPGCADPHVRLRCLATDLPRPRIHRGVPRRKAATHKADPHPADLAPVDQLPDAHLRLAGPARPVGRSTSCSARSASGTPTSSGLPITVILGLVYGYIPFMILPIYASLDRIPESLLEAGRDLAQAVVRRSGASRCRCPEPAILTGIVIVSPMFGDYYTNDLLGTARTSMFGNLIATQNEAHRRKTRTASLVLILSVIVLLPMMYYLRETRRASERGA